VFLHLICPVYEANGVLRGFVWISSKSIKKSPAEKLFECISMFFSDDIGTKYIAEPIPITFIEPAGG